MRLPFRISAVMLIAVIVLNIASTKPIDTGGGRDNEIVS